MSKRELQPRLEREGGIMKEDLSDVGLVEEKRRLLVEAAEKRRSEGESRGSRDQKGSKRGPGRMLQGGGMRWQVR